MEITTIMTMIVIAVVETVSVVSEATTMSASAETATVILETDIATVETVSKVTETATVAVESEIVPVVVEAKIMVVANCIRERWAVSQLSHLTNHIIGLITLVITVNTIIGIKQEGSADKACKALSIILAPHAHIIRDGVESMIPETEVVPGHIIILCLGGRTLSDLCVIELANIACR